MKIKLIACGICDSWHSPRAHNNHCPVCGAYVLVVRRKRIYFNWLTEREIIRSGWPMILKRLIATAASE
jgi:hypothetical protein